MVKVSSTPPRPAAWMTVDGVANSRMRWRQPPQGVPISSPSATVRIDAISRSPADTMTPMAAASAQMPSGYDAFSTLHPAYTLPDGVRIAAPTG